MKKFLLVLLATVLLIVGFTVYTPTSETITLPAPSMGGTVTIETTARVTMLMLNESFFMYKDEAICKQKVLFWNFRTGYVKCGTTSMTNVHHVSGNPNVPENYYATRKALGL